MEGSHGGGGSSVSEMQWVAAAATTGGIKCFLAFCSLMATHHVGPVTMEGERGRKKVEGVDDSVMTCMRSQCLKLGRDREKRW